MKAIASTIWIIPAAAHVAYVLATYDTLPLQVGAEAGAGGTSVEIFIIEWLLIFTCANAAFALIHIKLPKMSNRMLTVPKKEYWLQTEERKTVVIDKLKGICETSLLMINILFLAVYQQIYQSNVVNPIIKMSEAVLVAMFMVTPLLIAAIVIIASVVFFYRKNYSS